MKKLILLSLCLSLYFIGQAAVPTITSFTPTTGPVGTLVSISGTNLNTPTAFTIGGVTAIAVSNDGTTLVGMVMPGAITGTAVITTAEGTATSTGDFTVTATSFPGMQQGSKLVGTDNTGDAYQGSSISVSADGNTAIVGGSYDNYGKGAAWVYTRVAGVWTQQGDKLVGTGATSASNQGCSVSLSADGNTAIVGGYSDNYNKGAVWVYIRSGSTWTQQGSKLVGTGAVGGANQGSSVSLSADGNTALVGGQWDNNDQGAAWVYTRTTGVWSQQGSKLVGTGGIGTSQYQGRSVSLSADGNTAMVGGYGDNIDQGAAWVYTRTTGVWSQQGGKLVGTGAVGGAQQGISVSLSADGNTAMVGGYTDNSNQGAAWVYIRTTGVWSQQGGKLVGTGGIGTYPKQASSVSLSADGNTALVGGSGDNSELGASWVFIPVVAASSVTGIYPTNGSTAGGTTVTITGTNFTGATAVLFGSTAATNYTVNSSTQITATSPAGSGTVDVTVTTAGGTSITSSVDQFTYIVTPTVTTQAVSSIAKTSATGNGNITDLGAPNPTQYGVVWSTLTNPTVALTTKTTLGTIAATGAFNSSITGLAANTTYYIKAYATNTAGTSYGSEVSFTTLPIAPTVTTQAVSSIAKTSATGNGNITNLGVPNPTQYGVVWSTSTNPTVALTTKTAMGAIAATGAFTSPITGLTANTTYYIKAYATNTAGTSYGSEVSFTTLPLAPTVTTQAVSTIATSSATGNGNITDLGVPNPTQYGVVWSTLTNPTVALTTKTTLGTIAATGAFNSSITGLAANTTYYIKAYATNTAGTSYGSEVSFTTLPIAPTVTTQAVSSIAKTSATGNGNITDLGVPNPTQYGVVWSTLTNPTVALTTKTTLGTIAATGAFNSSITGLAANTTYYIKAYATNTAGTSYGSEVSFTTLPLAPTVTTQAVSSIAKTSATGNGNITDLGVPNPTQYGVVWSTLTNPTVALTTKTAMGAIAATGAFTSPITGLTANTTYYIKAYATNTAGTSYGSEVSFTTLPDITYSITSPTATNIKLTTATLGASIVPADAPVTERGIYWSTSLGVTTTDNNEVAVGTTGGTFTVDVTNLDNSSTIYYKGYVTTPAGITILSDESSFSNVPVFSGTGNWEDAERWNVQEVPAGEGSPVIDGICTITNTGEMDMGLLLCEDLIINSGAKLTLNAAQIFAVTGTITNHSGAEGFIIKADPALPNASFFYFNNAEITQPHIKASVGNAKKSNQDPLATVEMYSKASWDLSQPAGSKYNWQYFGIPVKTMAYSDVFSNCIVRKQYESSPDDAGLWKTQGPDSILTSGTGYELTQDAPTKYTFKGELTNADFSVSLPYTMSAKYPGQYVLGNPYTSAIDIKSITFGGNTDNSVYLYNTGTYTNSLSNTGYDGNAPGQYTVSSKETAGTDLIPNQIPSMQGFLVRSINEATGSIDIPSYVTWGPLPNTDMQRAPRKAASAEKVFTRIDVSGKLSADRMWIFTEPSCTRNFDNGWDGYKMMGSVLNPQLFAMEADGNYQIDAVNDLNEIYLGFQAGQDKEYSLKFTHQNTALAYGKLYLVDLLTGTTTDITADGSEYSFTAETSPEATKRFKIVTTITENQGIADKEQLKIYNSDGVLYIQNFSNQRGEFTLYDIKGVAIKRVQFEGNKLSTVSTQGLMPGAYVGKAETASLLKNEKLIIR
ncbi:MAG: IPT/TIG domain-containing protein [Paludibacter sp.]|nr:IPT/TIG domain-containing protein [Paludibacter sp.]